MAGPGRIYTRLERFQSDLLRGERAAASEITRAYGQAWQRIRGQLDDLTQRMQEAETAAASGGGKAEEPLSWLLQRNRLTSLQAQIEQELASVASRADDVVRQQQAEAVEAARQHTQQLIAAQLQAAPRKAAGAVVRWNVLPREAVSNLVGFTADGSPLADILSSLAADAGAQVRRSLIEGLALGQNPRQIARQIRAALGGNLTRALTISRTETIRAYREAAHQAALEQSGILRGWRWCAAKQDRTCPVCLALDGQEFPLEQRMISHPNCRCVQLFLVDGVELRERKTGEEWFAEQDEEVQRAVLGDAGFEAYRDGKVKLRDFVTAEPVPDETWGPAYRRRSLSEILGKNEE